MAPQGQPAQTIYARDERVLCFHHELLYEAKVLDSKLSDPNDKKSPLLYRVHYKGWKNTWDDWVNGDRLRKLTEENKELAQNLKKDLDSHRRPVPLKGPSLSSRKKTAGSDLSSTRGSEERHSSAPLTSRGQKRGRDYELDKVGAYVSSLPAAASTTPRSTKDTTIAPTGDRSISMDAFDLEDDSNDSDIIRVSPSPRVPVTQSGHRRRSLWQNRGQAEEPVAPLSRTIIESSAEEILAKPPTNPYARVGKGTKGPLPNMSSSLIGRSQGDIHSQLKRLNVHDPGNEAKRQFFKNVPTAAKLMIAGVPLERALSHPTSVDTFKDTSRSSHSHSSPHSPFPFSSPPRSKAGSSGSKPSAPATGNVNNFQEESFHARPAVRIVVPDHLKAILVDDWENVTKNLSLVPLPSKQPVNKILDAYFAEESVKRRAGSAEADLLEEVVAGVREYFDKCLGRILLYRFEREQYFEIRQLWESGAQGWEGKGPADAYGAEHLCRLFVSMPELIAQTNMDQQAINRLREEMAKMTSWLGKNSGRFFVSEYEAASQDYIEKARGI